MKDVEDIRRQKVECAFLKIESDSHDETATEFHVLVWHHLNVSNGLILGGVALVN